MPLHKVGRNRAQDLPGVDGFLQFLLQSRSAEIQALRAPRGGWSKQERDGVPFLRFDVQEVHAATIRDIDSSILAQEETDGEGGDKGDSLGLLIEVRLGVVDLGDLVASESLVSSKKCLKTIERYLEPVILATSS